MKILSVEAVPVRLPWQRDTLEGTAGAPTALEPSDADYRWSAPVNALYSIHFETALVRITTDSGLTGWGEAHAPLAPEVVCEIIHRLLAPVLAGTEYSGTVEEIRALWQRLHSTMRVRGQAGGFMLDAISGVDLALWDLGGKLQGLPVSQLIAGRQKARHSVPAYWSGLAGATVDEKVARARRAWQSGFRSFKVFYDSTAENLFTLLEALRSALGPEAHIAVDALWRLDLESAKEFGLKCDELGAMWLESPLAPEDPLPHGRLAAAIETPLALGECLRTVYELRPFFEAGAVTYVQPDPARCGLTEACRIADMVWELGKPLVPHVSLSSAPAIAAAVHLAASATQCSLLEYNPVAVALANRFLVHPIEVREAAYIVSQAPGLGIEWREFPPMLTSPASFPAL